MVPFEFPNGETHFCLIDSGASISIISEELHRIFGFEFERQGKKDIEGICGNNCISTLGITKPQLLRIPGLRKTFSIEFEVFAKKHRLDHPVIGQNFFRQAKVSFFTQGNQTFTEIEAP